MDITNFILNGQLNNYKVGNILKEDNDLIEVTTQEGDIPSIYQLNNDCYVIFLEVLDNKIRRIIIDLSYQIDERYYFDNKVDLFEFNYKTSLNNIVVFFNKIGLEFMIKDNQIIDEDKSTKILYLSSSNIFLMFYGEKELCLLKIYCCS